LITTDLSTGQAQQPAHQTEGQGAVLFEQFLQFDARQEQHDRRFDNHGREASFFFSEYAKFSDRRGRSNEKTLTVFVANGNGTLDQQEPTVGNRAFLEQDVTRGELTALSRADQYVELGVVEISKERNHSKVGIHSAAIMTQQLPTGIERKRGFRRDERNRGQESPRRRPPGVLALGFTATKAIAGSQDGSSMSTQPWSRTAAIRAAHGGV
jgi:hypothetical protein